MKVEKLSANCYRVRQMVNGTRYTILFDHEPSKKEIQVEMGKELTKDRPNSAEKGSLDNYIDKYLTKLEKENASPATVRGYVSIQNNIPSWLSNRDFYQLTNEDIQKFVDQYSKGRSPKTTRNAYGLIHAIFAEYRPATVLTIKLPPTKKKKEYEPSTKEIMSILDYAKGSHYSVALQLACLGLRRGEVMGLTLSDLSEDNVLIINKDLVQDKDNNYVIKNTPKNAASNRKILIPESLANEIREQGYIFQGNPHTVNEYLHKVQDTLGIPRFRLHIMRHFAGAYLLKNGFTRDQILQYGGWEKGSNVFEKIYSYNLDPEDSQKEIATSLGSLFD